MPTINRRDCRSRKGFTLVELLVVMAIIGILVGMLLPAVQQVREAARRSECLNNIRQIGIAIQSYESSLRRLPPGWVDLFDTAFDPNTAGEPNMSFRYGWATMISQFIEQDNLYKTYDPRTRYWGVDGPPQAVFDDASTVITIYTCPSDPAPDINANWPGLLDVNGDPVGLAKMNYGGNGGIGLVGDQITAIESFVLDPDIDYIAATAATGSGEKNDAYGIFCCNSKVRFKDITDGTTNTVIVGERGGSDHNAADSTNPVARRDTSNLLVRIGLPDSRLTPDCPLGAPLLGLGGDGSAQVSMGPMVANSITNPRTTNFYDPRDYMINAASDFDSDGLNSFSSGYSSAHPSGANFGFADGSHRLVADNIDLVTFQQLLQRNDGFVVDLNSF